MKSNVTRLYYAKALRAMGVPLNTHVEDRKFSPSTERKITAVFRETRALGNAVLPWAQKQTAQRYAAVFRGWEKLERALAKAVPRNDEPEVVALLIEPCRLISEQWDAIFTAFENGKPIKITAGEGAPWPLGPFPRNPHKHPPRR